LFVLVSCAGRTISFAIFAKLPYLIVSCVVKTSSSEQAFLYHFNQKATPIASSVTIDLALKTVTANYLSHCYSIAWDR